MGPTSILFLAVGLLPSILALLEVKLDKGVAVFDLVKLNCDDAKLLEGGQGFVRFAKVVESPEGAKFGRGVQVALKFSNADKKEELQHEQEAHNFIRNKDPEVYADCVVEAEESLGRSKDSNGELVLPNEESKQDEYLILIMERLGRNLKEKQNKVGGIFHAKQEIIYDQLCAILMRFKKIGFVHGDIKLLNILLKNNDVNGGIKLTDLGLSVYKGCRLVRFGGDADFMSPIQSILERQATHNDCAVSGAFSFAHFAIGDLSWFDYTADWERHHEKIVVEKIEFIQNPFATYEGQIPKTYEKKISDTLKTATKDEIGSDIIQYEIDRCKKATENDSKKKGNSSSNHSLAKTFEIVVK